MSATANAVAVAVVGGSVVEGPPVNSSVTGAVAIDGIDDDGSTVRVATGGTATVDEVHPVAATTLTANMPTSERIAMMLLCGETGVICADRLALRDAGLLAAAEFEAKRAEILGRI